MHAGHLRMKYTGWYPALQFGADINNEKRYRVKVVREGNKASTVVERVDKPLVELSALAYVPLDLSSHGWNRGISLDGITLSTRFAVIVGSSIEMPVVISESTMQRTRFGSSGFANGSSLPHMRRFDWQDMHSAPA